MPHDLSTPLKCLALALNIIESYQSDIRNSQWTGVDLLDKGFCQGSMYLRTTEQLQQAPARFVAESGDAQY